MTGRSQIEALLACDLDGTLLTAAGTPAPGIVEALADLDARGARLVVCTGRPLHRALKAVAALRADPIAFVCYHGALVVDATTGTWLRHLMIPDDVASGVVREALALGLAVTLYDGDERRELAPVACGAALDLRASPGLTRLVLAGAPRRLAEALPRLAAAWGHSVRLERAGGGTIAILPAAADKGEGLRLVAAHLAVPGRRIVGCGDAAGDESLLAASGIGIAVGDAPASLRAAAQQVVSQGDLAEALRRAVEALG